MNFTLQRPFPAYISIIIITCIVSVIALILGAFNQNWLLALALQPSLVLQGQAWWTLVTHIFVHAGLWHLIFNMIALFSLGGLTERIIGRKRFVWFYLISGVLAGLLSVILAGFFGYGLGAKIFGSPLVPMVGASGAIFAVAGLLMVLLPRLRFSIIFFPFFTLPAFVMIPVVLLVTWLVSVTSGFPIGNVAHLGGFLAGVAYGAFLRKKYPQKTALLQRYFR